MGSYWAAPFFISVSSLFPSSSKGPPPEQWPTKYGNFFFTSTVTVKNGEETAAATHCDPTRAIHATTVRNEHVAILIP